MARNADPITPEACERDNYIHRLLQYDDDERINLSKRRGSLAVDGHIEMDRMYR